MIMAYTGPPIMSISQIPIKRKPFDKGGYIAMAYTGPSIATEHAQLSHHSVGPRDMKDKTPQPPSKFSVSTKIKTHKRLGDQSLSLIHI